MKYLVTMPKLSPEDIDRSWAKVIEASGGSGMTMDRAYTNRDEGFVCCCWNAPSLESLEGLFEKAGAPFDKMEPVTEYLAAGWW